MSKYDRFIDEDMDWLVEIEKPVERKVDYIQDPTTGHLMGSHPGGGDTGGEKEGGGGKGSGGKAKGNIKELKDFKDENIAISQALESSAPEIHSGFIDTWNNYVAKTPGDFKKEFFGGGSVTGSMTVNYDDYEGAIIVKTYLKDEEGHRYGQMDATIYPKENRVHMDYYLLDDSEQAHGVMKGVMAHEMQMWQDMGVTKVDLYANINIGGYAWAKYGFEPENVHVWHSLASDVEYQIERLSADADGEGGGTGRAESWDELSAAYQSRVENSWMRDTHSEFVESEMNSWRDSGSALEQAKTDLAKEFNDRTGSDWGRDVVQDYVKEMADAGTPVPFTTDDIMNSITLNYSSRNSDGRGDVEVEFNDDALANPVGTTYDPNQKPLPGIDKIETHEYLTEKMRDDIKDTITNEFASVAEGNEADIRAPGWIRDQATEYQAEVWDGMDDEERFAWAERNRSDLISGAYSRPPSTGEMPRAEAEALLKLARSNDPRALWAISDSKWGKTLLIRKNWNGKFNMKDQGQMERFKSYVDKRKK